MKHSIHPTQLGLENFQAALSGLKHSEEWKYVDLKRLTDYIPQNFGTLDAQSACPELKNKIWTTENSPQQNSFLALPEAQPSHYQELDLAGKNLGAFLLEYKPEGKHQFLLSHLRLVCPARAKIQLNISVQSAPDAANLLNQSWEIILGEEAEFELNFLDQSSGSNLNFYNFSFACAGSSSLLFNHYTHGSAISKLNCQAALNGEEAKASFNSLALLAKRQAAHSQFLVEHKQPNTYSEEAFRAILRDESIAEFSGKIIVSPHAIGTDAKQLTRHLLLSDLARAHTRPQLEILADDVKCSHGATVGQLDAEQLFYLGARGLSPKEAEESLLKGFISELLDRCTYPDFRQAFTLQP